MWTVVHVAAEQSCQSDRATLPIRLGHIVSKSKRQCPKFAKMPSSLNSLRIADCHCSKGFTASFNDDARSSSTTRLVEHMRSSEGVMLAGFDFSSRASGGLTIRLEGLLNWNREESCATSEDPFWLCGGSISSCALWWPSFVLSHAFCCSDRLPDTAGNNAALRPVLRTAPQGMRHDWIDQWS